MSTLKRLSFDLLNVLCEVIPTHLLFPLNELLVQIEPRLKDVININNPRYIYLRKIHNTRVPRMLVAFEYDEERDDICEDTGCYICPLCGKQEDDVETTIQRDYVSYKNTEVYVDPYATNPFKTMVWGDCCDSRLVMDPYIEPIEMNEQEARIMYPNLQPVPYPKYYKKDGFLKCKYYDVALARITHIVDTPLVGARTRSTTKLTDEQLRRLVASRGTDYRNKKTYEKYDPDIIKELKIYNLDELEEGYDEMLKDKQCFDLALPVDSISAFHPRIEYPKGMELDHDGQNIDLRCVSGNGKEFGVRFWGD